MLNYADLIVSRRLEVHFDNVPCVYLEMVCEAFLDSCGLSVKVGQKFESCQEGVHHGQWRGLAYAAHTRRGVALAARSWDVLLKPFSASRPLALRTESVAEKMLTNWFTFLLYKFLKVSLRRAEGSESASRSLQMAVGEGMASPGRKGHRIVAVSIPLRQGSL